MAIRIPFSDAPLRGQRTPGLSGGAPAYQPIPAGVAAAAGGFAAGAAQVLGEFAEAQQKAADATALSKAKLAYRETLATAEEAVAGGGYATGEQAGQAFRQMAQEGAQQIRRGLSSRLAGAFDLDAAEATLPRLVQVRQDAAKRQSQEGASTIRTTLLRLGNDAGAAANPAARQQAIASAMQEIDRGVEARLINPEQAGNLRRGFLSDVDEADARRLITANPAEAERRLNTPGQYPNLSDLARARLYDSANRRVEAEATRAVAAMAAAEARASRMEREAERRQRLGADRAANDLWGRIAAANAGTGEMPSLAEVQAQREWLSPGEFRALASGVTARGAREDDPQTRVDLEGRADTTDPVGFQALVGRAVDRGELTPATAAGLIRQNRTARKDDQPATPYSSGRRFVLDGLDPGNVVFGNVLRGPLAAARQSALADFDTWIERNPTASREQAVEEGRRLVRTYADQTQAQARSTLPTPYGWAGQRIDITPETLRQAALNLAQARGSLDPATYTREAETLRAWQQVLSPPAPPQPPAQQQRRATGNARGAGPAAPAARTE